MTLLTKHVGHALLVLDPLRVRCEACAYTLVLGSTSSTSSSAQQVKLEVDRNPRFGEAGTCLRHPGEWASLCSGCAADRKQAREPRALPLPDMDRKARGVALVRAAASQAKSAPKGSAE